MLRHDRVSIYSLSRSFLHVPNQEITVQFLQCTFVTEILSHITLSFYFSKLASELGHLQVETARGTFNFQQALPRYTASRTK